MKTSSVFRASLLVAALGAALSAQAVQIGLTSSGSMNLVANPGNSTIDETVLLQQDGFGPLTLLHIDFVNTLIPVAGTGVYTGAGGTLSFAYSWSTNVVTGATQALSGTWSMTGGTGTYANMTGFGTITTNIDYTFVPEATFTTFRGELQAVPEPASMAALGVGAAALLRRRKRA